VKKRPVSDYSVYDRMEVTSFLFHPRPEMEFIGARENFEDLTIPVDKDITIGARLHTAHKSWPVILFFHGNGEIVSDYDELGPLYNHLGINFLPVDYRGYGRSTGYPSVSFMMKDCHVIYEYVKDWVKAKGYNGKFIVMGRSLGSASALELASVYKNEIDGLIIESGFAFAVPLLKLLGINTEALGIKEGEGFNNLNKIKDCKKPTLIIHAEYDHIIPFTDGHNLYDSCGAAKKIFLKINGANHNTIFAHGLQEYLKAVKTLVEDITAP